MASASLIFLFCFLSFAIVLVLGGGPAVTTLEVEVYRLARISLDLDNGSALAIVESLLSLFILYLYITVEQKHSGNTLTSTNREEDRPRLKGIASFFSILYALLLTFLILAPLAAVIINSFRKKGAPGSEAQWTLEWYRQILGLSSSRFGSAAASGKALITSLLFAGSSVVIGVPFSMGVSYILARKKVAGSRIIQTLLMLPMGISPIILGLGYLRIIQSLPRGFSAQSIAIVCAHIIMALPFMMRILSSRIRGLDLNLSLAAGTLGASSFQIFRTIELPLLRSSLAAAATFCFAISIGEINATLMLADHKIETLPLSIYSMIGHYNFYGASALGTFLIIFCFLSFLILDGSDNL